MCRWLSYIGAPIFLERLLFEPRFSLIEQSLHARKGATETNGDGFGVGWYGEREEPGLFRDVLPAWNDGNLRSLAHHIRSSLFFAHVRASTGTATMRANCHPFACNGWLFMHNGQIGGYDRMRRDLEATLPDDLYTHRRGTTDSEAMFLSLLAKTPEGDPKAAIEGMIAEVATLQKVKQVDEPFRMTIALTDGKSLYAARYASDEEPPSLFFAEDDEGVLVVSEPLGVEGMRWKPVPPNAFLEKRLGRPISLSSLEGAF